jgi:hypothetical protein
MEFERLTNRELINVRSGMQEQLDLLPSSSVIDRNGFESAIVQINYILTQREDTIKFPEPPEMPSYPVIDIGQDTLEEELIEQATLEHPILIQDEVKSYLDDAQEVAEVILIGGKTIEDWYLHFDIDIPETPNFQDIHSAASRCNRLISEVNKLLAIYQTSQGLIKLGNKLDLRKAEQEILAEYKTKHKAVPQNSLLVTLAEAKLTKDAKKELAGIMAVSLFKGIREKLGTTADLLKSQAYMLRHEANLMKMEEN